jgi:hypothetical protein
MQVDKAHVAVPNWPTEDFQEAHLSNAWTLKRAGMNSAQLKEFSILFLITYCLLDIFWFLEREYGIF